MIYPRLCPRLMIAALLGAVSVYGQIATTTTLSSVVPAAPLFGQKVTLTATVSPAVSVGSVAFMDGGVLVGVRNVSAGNAAMTTVTLPAGRHSLRAVYGGGGGNSPSQSGSLAYMVTASSNAGFTPAPSPSATTGPGSIALADFNGDGQDDLAIVGTNGNYVAILLGNGDGTFQTPLNSTVGVGPSAVAVGDFNGDGRIDLVVPNLGTGKGSSISILLGNGDGTFLPAMSTVVGSPARSIAVGDFNGDGRAD